MEPQEAEEHGVVEHSVTEQDGLEDMVPTQEEQQAVDAFQLPILPKPWYLNPRKWKFLPPSNIYELLSHGDEDLKPTEEEWEAFLHWAHSVAEFSVEATDQIRSMPLWKRPLTRRLCMFLHFYRIGIPIKDIRKGRMMTRAQWEARGRQPFKKASYVLTPIVTMRTTQRGDWWSTNRNFPDVESYAEDLICHYNQTAAKGQKEKESRLEQYAALQAEQDHKYTHVWSCKRYAERVLKLAEEDLDRFGSSKGFYAHLVTMSDVDNVRDLLVKLALSMDIGDFDVEAATQLRTQAEELDSCRRVAFAAAQKEYEAKQAEVALFEKQRAEELAAKQKIEEEERAEEEGQRLEKERIAAEIEAERQKLVNAKRLLWEEEMRQAGRWPVPEEEIPDFDAMVPRAGQEEAEEEAAEEEDVGVDEEAEEGAGAEMMAEEDGIAEVVADEKAGAEDEPAVEQSSEQEEEGEGAVAAEATEAADTISAAEEVDHPNESPPAPESSAVHDADAKVDEEVEGQPDRVTDEAGAAGDDELPSKRKEGESEGQVVDAVAAADVAHSAAEVGESAPTQAEEIEGAHASSVPLADDQPEGQERAKEVPPELDEEEDDEEESSDEEEEEEEVGEAEEEEDIEEPPFTATLADIHIEEEDEELPAIDESILLDDPAFDEAPEDDMHFAADGSTFTPPFYLLTGEAATAKAKEIRSTPQLLQAIRFDESYMPNDIEWRAYTNWVRDVLRLPAVAKKLERECLRPLTARSPSLRMCLFLHFLRIGIPTEQLSVHQFNTEAGWRKKGRTCLSSASPVCGPVIQGSVDWWIRPAAIPPLARVRKLEPMIHFLQTYPNDSSEEEYLAGAIGHLRDEFEKAGAQTQQARQHALLALHHVACRINTYTDEGKANDVIPFRPLFKLRSKEKDVKKMLDEKQNSPEAAEELTRMAIELDQMQVEVFKAAVEQKRLARVADIARQKEERAQVVIDRAKKKEDILEGMRQAHFQAIQDKKDARDKIRQEAAEERERKRRARLAAKEEKQKQKQAIKEEKARKRKLAAAERQRKAEEEAMKYLLAERKRMEQKAAGDSEGMTRMAPLPQLPQIPGLLPEPIKKPKKTTTQKEVREEPILSPRQGPVFVSRSTQREDVTVTRSAKWDNWRAPAHCQLGNLGTDVEADERADRLLMRAVEMHQEFAENRIWRIFLQKKLDTTCLDIVLPPSLAYD